MYRNLPSAFDQHLLSSGYFHWIVIVFYSTSFRLFKGFIPAKIFFEVSLVTHHENYQSVHVCGGVEVMICSDGSL